MMQHWEQLSFTLLRERSRSVKNNSHAYNTNNMYCTVHCSRTIKYDIYAHIEEVYV
jgi:hypothetical protein